MVIHRPGKPKMPDAARMNMKRRLIRSISTKILCGFALPLAMGAAPDARAADKAPSAPLFSWAGFYIGANLGGAIPLHTGEALRNVGGFAGPGFDLFPRGSERSGLTVGAQVGYNWQYANWVYGVETDFNYLDGRRAPSGTYPAPPAYAAMGVGSYTLVPESSGTYFSSYRARLGFAIDRTLYYVTAGVANGGWRGISTLTLNGGGPGNPFTSGNSASSRMKYVVGAGVEYALDATWSARLEYLYLNQSLGAQLFDNGGGFDFASRLRTESHIVRFGMNYHFGEDPAPAAAADGKEPSAAASPERYSVHLQTTVLPQGYPAIRAPYSGENSLPPGGQVRATVSSTAFFGLRLWEGGEAYVNPEIDQGFGVAGTFGVAGFPSAEAYKLGRAAPYVRFERYFVRQTFGLGGEPEPVKPSQNFLAGSVDSNRLTFTVGKYAITDIIDDNQFAHDGRNGFMNWSILDMGAFDYAGDAWSFTDGATAEWRQDWWTARAGFYQLSLVPGSEFIEPVLFRQWSPVVELEARHKLLFGQDGKIKLLGFANIGYMGKYDEATQIGFLTGTTPDITLNRRKRNKIGGGINVEQPISDDLGFFLRVSMANGRYESFDFTDIERSLSTGLVLTGTKWERPNDAIGVAVVFNGISNSHANYLAAGGLGLLIGDGRLNYDGEHILETYYKYSLMAGLHLTADYQFVQNPAYNRDRGPANIFALRLHGEF
jgi:high affinity Mn2+ porin